MKQRIALRIHMAQSRMTMAQADILQYYLENCEAVEEVKGRQNRDDHHI
ncbi:MAG: hypothetical protein ACLTDF_09850 [Coprococcus sp.]